MRYYALHAHLLKHSIPNFLIKKVGLNSFEYLVDAIFHFLIGKKTRTLAFWCIFTFLLNSAIKRGITPYTHTYLNIVFPIFLLKKLHLKSNSIFIKLVHICTFFKEKYDNIILKQTLKYIPTF